jgi:hypothetical protein
VSQNASRIGQPCQCLNVPALLLCCVRRLFSGAVSSAGLFLRPAVERDGPFRFGRTDCGYASGSRECGAPLFFKRGNGFQEIVGSQRVHFLQKCRLDDFAGTYLG